LDRKIIDRNKIIILHDIEGKLTNKENHSHIIFLLSEENPLEEIKSQLGVVFLFLVFLQKLEQNFEEFAEEVF